ncbi:hypothetical protein BKA70DRAFT_50106 [Coprinopsis sp. MPI-PUGE-AT-0042]|nr:hypothetical protein BKA70DRAFT_50106 [Coprinopsis sp. MPI-PUGE-AT-0042]
MGMTRKRSSSHPPSIHNYPQQPATNSSSRAPFFSAFSSTQPPPPEVPQVQPEPAYFVATSPSHGSSSRHAVSPEEDYTKVTTTRSSIASTLKREHMGMTRRRSNFPAHAYAIFLLAYPLLFFTTPRQGALPSDSQALPSAMVDGNGRHHRRASFRYETSF